jgi:anti-sigma-K factor RskA
METELSHDQVLELLPAYALGALEPEEMLAVDDYLNHNPALLDRLHQLELAAAQMALAAPDTPLPAEAKNQLLARIEDDLASQTAPQVTTPATAPRLAAQKNRPAALPADKWWTGLRHVFGSTQLWAAATAAAVVALVVLGFYFNQLRARLETLQTEIGQLQAVKTELEQTNASLQQQLLENQGQLQQASTNLDALQAQAADLQAANTQLQQQAQNSQELLALIGSASLERTVPLPGTEEAPQASGTFYLTDNDQGVLVLRGLEPLPPDQTYQLWLIPAGGPPAPAGLLAVQIEPATWLKLQVPPDAPADFAAVGVSVEPAGGSPTPTGPIVLLGKIG